MYLWLYKSQVPWKGVHHYKVGVILEYYGQKYEVPDNS